MLNWFKKRKSEPETIPAQIHPTPKLPPQANAINERIVEDPNPRPPEKPVEPPKEKKPPVKSPITPLRKMPAAKPKPVTIPDAAESRTTKISLDENGLLDSMILPLEELEAAEKAAAAFSKATKPAESKPAESKPAESKPNPSSKPSPITPMAKEEESEKEHKASSLRPVQPLKPDSNKLKNDQKVLYRQLLSGMYDAVIITDPKGHVIETNGRVRDLFLFNADSLWDVAIAKLIRGITPPLLARLRHNLDKHRHVLLDATCNRADGTTFAAEVAISGVSLMNDGDFVFTVRNVDKRHQTMVKMKMYQNALERSPCPTGIADKNGILLYGNPALATFLKQELSSMTGFDFSNALSDESVAALIATAVTDGGKWEGTTTFKLPDGTTTEGILSITPDSISKEKAANTLIYILPS